MSSIFLPLPSQESTSDSANTVQVVLIFTGRSPRSAVGAELVERDVERARRGAEEPAGAGGALVVHAEVDDLAVGGDADRLGVLAAHVDHGAGGREHVHRAAAVAADLGDLGVAEGHLVAAVAGADDVLDLLLAQAAVGERLVERLLGGAHDVGAGHHQGAADDAALLVEDDRLGLGRSDVDSGGVGHRSSLRLRRS